MNLHERLRTNKTEYDLSVLVLTLRNRVQYLSELLEKLNKQSQFKSVQILWLGDNKSLITGDKRNALLSLANGRYVTFVDDDDMISNDYIESILEAIKTSPEVITFQVSVSRDGQHTKTQIFKREHAGNYTTETIVTGKLSK